MIETTGTGADFDGMKVAVAFNLNRCGPKKHPPAKECFTVFGPGRKVLAYVDSILLESCTFPVSKAGVDRIRREQKRSVIAYIEGIARDPRKVMKSINAFENWVPFTFCPYTDYTFMVPTGPQERCGEGARRPGKPIVEAEWVYFDSASKKAIAKPYTMRKNPASQFMPVRSEEELSVLAQMVGGDLSSMMG